MQPARLTEHNEGVVPIFSTWLQPFHDLGAATVTLAPTTGTNHQSYDRIGLPGFQFIQDEIDSRRTWRSRTSVEVGRNTRKKTRPASCRARSHFRISVDRPRRCDQHRAFRGANHARSHASQEDAVHQALLVSAERNEVATLVGRVAQ